MDDITFERFLEMKEEWLTHIRTEWLVMGHLTQENALSIVNKSIGNIKNVKPIAKDIPFK